MTLKALSFLGYALLVAVMGVAAVILGSILFIGAIVLLFIALILDAVVIVLGSVLPDDHKLNEWRRKL